MSELVRLLQTDANAANAFGALASATVAVLALFASGLSVWLSLRALTVQQRHNVLSVRPLPEVTVADYEDSLRVKIRNNGSGPMMIRSLSVSDGTESKSSVIDWMPDLPGGRAWNTFSHALVNRSLLAGTEIVLLELSEYEGEKGYLKCRNATRKALCKLTVTVEYTDMYESTFQTYSKSLEWFGRYLSVA